MVILLSDLMAGISTVRTLEVVKPATGSRGLHWH